MTILHLSDTHRLRFFHDFVKRLLTEGDKKSNLKTNY